MSQGGVRAFWGVNSNNNRNCWILNWSNGNTNNNNLNNNNYVRAFAECLYWLNRRICMRI